MRRTIELVIRVALRSRVGMALLLAVLVLAIVGSAKIFSDSDDDIGLTGAPERPIVTATPTIPNDGLAGPEPTPSPITSPGTAAPKAVARAFAEAWLNHRSVSADQWYAKLLPHCTESLADKLAGVDPAVVPADRLTGEPTVIPYAENVVDVAVPVDSGRLRLRLTAPDGRWLVDGVDWERT
ncbi:hypothetical protein WEI85_02600 [Actinomycetes bacterium KLBMP 9797]